MDKELVGGCGQLLMEGGWLIDGWIQFESKPINNRQSFCPNWNNKFVTTTIVLSFAILAQWPHWFMSLSTQKTCPSMCSSLKNFWLKGKSRSCQTVEESQRRVLGKRLKEKDQSHWCLVMWKVRPSKRLSRAMEKVFQLKAWEKWVFFSTIEGGKS